MSNLNAVDFLVLIIFALSILAGMMRGFLKEAISVASWIAAAFVASTFANPLAARFSGAASQAAQSAAGSSVNVGQSITVLAIGISFIVLFVLTLFVGSIIGYLFSGAASSTGLGFFNRILGAGFGFARGYIMVIVFMFVCELTPIGAQPAWGQSTFVQSFQPTVKWFSDWVQPGLQSLESMGSAAYQRVTGGAGSSVTNAIQNVTGK
jgi:membrane protein required for colicin V production